MVMVYTTSVRLEESHEYLNAIMQTTKDGFWALDTQARFTDVNAAYLAMSGYTREEFLHMSVSDVDTYESTQDTQLHIQNIRTKGHDLFETRHRRKDGSEFLVEVSVSFLDLEGGRLICFCRDITARKRTENELVRVKKQLADSMLLSDLVRWELDIRNDLFTFNEYFYKLYATDEVREGGYSMSSAEYVRRFVFEDDIAYVASVMEVATQNPDSEIHRLEHRIRRGDGEIRSIVVSYVTEFDDGGNAVFRYGSNQDITERKRMEGQIRTLAAEKDLLLKETHHRVKNDMSMVRSLLNLQAVNTSNEEARNVLMDAVNRMQGMVILYGKLYQTTEYGNLSSREFLVPLIAEMVNVIPSTCTINTEVQVSDTRQTPRVLSRLGIIVNELVTNSLKYAFAGREHGSIAVSLYKTEKTTTLEYSDDGIGLPDHVRIDGTTGFGMQLVSMMVQDFGGTMEILRGRGCRIVIRWQ